MTKTPIEGAFQQYLQEIKKSVLKGDYTEMTLRTPLENFIKALNGDYDVTHEAKRIKDLGGPDFTAYRSKINIGYIEAKELGKNLDEVLESTQIKRYRESIDNIILTDYRRFILIRSNQTIFDQSLFSNADLKDPKIHVRENKIDEFMQLIDTFFGYSQPTIRSALVLAEELAKKTKLLKDLAIEQLQEDLSSTEKGKTRSPIYNFHEALSELINDASVEYCADSYAQSLVYGLFLASYYHHDRLDRDSAYRYIPKNIKVIRRIFSSISGDYLPANVSWIIDDIINILNASEIEEILTEITSGRGAKDPFYVFYEDFLAFYEPERRKLLGVYYTPSPVVNFIVSSIHQILIDSFNKPDGFVDNSVTVLDPAVGTGSFLSSAFVKVLDELRRTGLKGLIPKKIENHLLQDFHGFEILITPYVIAHLKLTLLLNYYYRFNENDRISVYLTNTLDPFETHTYVPFLGELTDESQQADAIKLKQEILVVLGNPPYSESSSNKSRWIQEKMQDYKRGLNEKNIRPLDDDYIKFLRFAHWKIEQSGKGVVGFITNNSYLDGAIHRQMRKELLRTFNQIYIVNVRGDARKKDRCPDGSKDENVFDIQQGTAIIFLVKKDGESGSKVFYFDLYGLRKDKYAWLEANTLQSIQWIELTPRSPDYFFVPINLSLKEEYGRFWGIKEIFKDYGPSVTSARDKLTIKWTAKEVWDTVSTFVKMDIESARTEFGLGKDTRDWKVDLAQKDLKRSGLNQEKIAPILWKPFDIRYTYYTGKARGFLSMPRAIMQNMLRNNIGLIVQRAMIPNHPCNFFFVSSHMIANGIIRSDNKSRESLFPLYIYESQEEDSKRPNLTPEFFAFIKQRYEGETTPEAILGYIYAVLFSVKFREKYCELLRIDFPRIPFVDDVATFLQLSQVGTELIDLHLMNRHYPSTIRYDVQGSNIVEFVRYKESRVFINNLQYFDEVPEKIWSFSIGAYKVLDKWLKSRKGRELSIEDIEHFLQIVEVIKKTIELMTEIDTIIDFDEDFQTGTQTIKTASLNSDLSSYL